MSTTSGMPAPGVGAEVGAASPDPGREVLGEHAGQLLYAERRMLRDGRFPEVAGRLRGRARTGFRVQVLSVLPNLALVALYLADPGSTGGALRWTMIVLLLVMAVASTVTAFHQRRRTLSVCDDLEQLGRDAPDA